MYPDGDHMWTRLGLHSLDGIPPAVRLLAVGLDSLGTIVVHAERTTKERSVSFTDMADITLLF